MISPKQDPSIAERQGWLGILARARVDELENAWKAADVRVDFDWLRRPHFGLVMVRARAGGTGSPFNLGEMTITRCSVQLGNGTIGHGYVQGRDKRRAELAALLDSLLQQETHRIQLMARSVEPLRLLQEERRNELSRKAASTKVEFFTMARAENPE